MSVKIEGKKVIIESDNAHLNHAIDDLVECRQSLFDLIGMQQDDSIHAKTTYYGIMLLKMTEPSHDQWKAALQAGGTLVKS